jgi:hypothetical protein
MSWFNDEIHQDLLLRYEVSLINSPEYFPSFIDPAYKVDNKTKTRVIRLEIICGGFALYLYV